MTLRDIDGSTANFNLVVGAVAELSNATTNANTANLKLLVDANTTNVKLLVAAVAELRDAVAGLAVLGPMRQGQVARFAQTRDPLGGLCVSHAICPARGC